MHKTLCAGIVLVCTVGVALAADFRGVRLAKQISADTLGGAPGAEAD